MEVRKIELMHKLFGEKSDAKCKECSNLLRFWYRTKSYRKCAVYGATHSDATDWCISYPACGMFCKEYSGRNIVRLVHPDKKEPEPPLDGQIDMFGGNADET